MTTGANGGGVGVIFVMVYSTGEPAVSFDDGEQLIEQVVQE